MNESVILTALAQLSTALRRWQRAGNDAAEFDYEGWANDNLLPIYSEEFATILAQRATDLGQSLGVELDRPDDRAVQRLARGRLRILNLGQQARNRISQILAQARRDGLNPHDPTVVSQIAQQVPAGRFATPEERARIIAREETANAQNEATLDVLENNGYTHVRARDAQLGPTDAECEARNGRVFTIHEARREQAEEHPNGTLSWDPVIVKSYLPPYPLPTYPIKPRQLPHYEDL